MKQYTGMVRWGGPDRDTRRGWEKVACMVISMRKMAVDQAGRISAITASGELGRRIRDMGLVPGTEILIVGRAPLVDPVAVRMKGFTLSLRNNEADYIDVEAL
jgi:ferrous iron transport protein A